MKKTIDKPVLTPPRYARESGILLPVFSLPSPYMIGDLGEAAYDFVDQLQNAGQKLWQVLPMNPVSYGNSPYQTPCTFAGNIYAISPQLLTEKGWITKARLRTFDFGQNPCDIDYGKLYWNRPAMLREVWSRWKVCPGRRETGCFEQFVRVNEDWLEEYALFAALKEYYGGLEWVRWEADIRDRRPEALMRWRGKLKEQIEFHKFCQFIFYDQWNALHEYAHKKGVRIIGDLPFYVAFDSVDVWSHRDLFMLSKDGLSVRMFGGVPADYFAEKDRNWGNPVYDWDMMCSEGFEWWKKRIRHCGKMYDVLRIDHAVGLVRFYGIPGKDAPEADSAWYEGPDAFRGELTGVIAQEAAKSGMEIIAEDLGSVNDRLRNLIKELDWSGMRVLQFGFGGHYGAKNTHLPHFYTPHTVVYTGTHDNETLAQFIAGRNSEELSYMMRYLRVHTTKELIWGMIEEAYRSCAEKVIIPMQDILGLDDSSRVCFPGEFEHSWRWRLAPGMFTIQHQRQLRQLAQDFARI